MSRSYKKHPGYTDSPHGDHKRWANKVVRRTRDITDGCLYKKHYPQWDICDFKCIYYSNREWLEFSAPNRSDWGTEYDPAYRARMK